MIKLTCIMQRPNLTFDMAIAFVLKRFKTRRILIFISFVDQDTRTVYDRIKGKNLIYGYLKFLKSQY